MTAPLIRVRATAPGEPDRWLITASPWDGLPDKLFMSWRCCDDGPPGVIRDVELHLPRNTGDPAYTVEVEFDAGDLAHLTDRHGFGLG